MTHLSSRQRLLVIFAALPIVLTITSLAYMAVMSQVEGEPRTFWQSLEWAGETLTTTGYGADAAWDHPASVLFVVGLQFVGVFLVYTLVPFYMLPLIEERFERRLPSKPPSKLEGHVVILRYGAAVETLIEELLDAGVPVVIAELDEEQARDLIQARREGTRRYRRVYPIYQKSVASLLGRCRLADARALVLNGSDGENATAVLVASELGCTADIVALLEEPSLRQPLELAGAKAVYTPRHVLGEGLAARASQRVQPRADGTYQLGKYLRVEEIRLDPEGPIAGLTLAEAEVAARTGATLLGQWVQGELDAELTSATRLEPNGILLAIGRPESLDQLRELARAGDVQRSGPIIVAGCGEVGSRVAELLLEAGEPVLTVDRHVSEPGKVDLVGDIADPKLLEQLDLERARSVVLALDSDSSTLFATLVIKGAVPSLPTIARVNRAENLDRIYRAGADFALSISQVSAKILAQRLLGRASIALDSELQLLTVKVAPESSLCRRHPSATEIRERSGCSVVGVERGEEVITDFEGTFLFHPGDTVYVCGHHTDTDRFAEIYG